MERGYRWLIVAAMVAMFAACSGGGGGAGGGGDTGPGEDNVTGGDATGDVVPADGTAGEDTEPGEDTGPGEDTIPGDPCDPNPCQDAHKTVCEDVDGAAACSCDEGWVEDEQGDCQEANPGCDGGDPLQLVISDPPEDFIAWGEDTISVSGFASDCVTGIAWTNSQGGEGDIDGGTSWIVEAIPLALGDNVISFTATGGADEATVTDSLTVVYTGNDVQVLSPVYVEPDEILVDTPTPVLVRIALEDAGGLVEDSVRLLVLDEDLQPVDGEPVADLLDDGNVDAGDDIPADGVFSGTFVLDEAEPTLLKYRIAWDVLPEGGELETAYSEVVTVEVLQGISLEQAIEAMAFQDEVAGKYAEYQETASDEDEARQMTFTFVEDHELVDQALLSEFGIWWLLTSGLEGLLYFDVPEGKDALPVRQQEYRFGPVNAQSPAADRARLAAERFGLRPSPLARKTFPIALEDDIPVGSKQAVIYAPWYTENAGLSTAFEDDVNTLLVDSECPEYFVSAYYKDAAADVDSFKNMGGNGIIVVHTHGGYFAVGGGVNKVVLSTGEAATPELVVQHAIDIVKKRVSVISARGGRHFVLYPEFFKKYAKNLPQSLIYMGACHSLQNGTLAAALLGNGAKTYYGFNESVFKTFNDAIAKTLFASLVTDHDNAKEAFDDAVAANGAADADGAAFVMIGENKLSIYVEELINPGFEKGTTQGWVKVGDARVIAKLGPIMPTEGKYMGIVSTGLGSVNDSDSAIFQTVCIPEGATAIGFSYNVVSEEPMEWVGSSYDDKFEATFEVAGAPTVVATETVNTSAWLAVSGIDFYGGDSTVFQTGWKTAEGAVTPGETVTIRFRVWDLGDSIYDTAALIDQVYLVTPE
ncbi:MAG: hypothetical protein ABIK09_19460 [Pseudomonadota bacterium]